MDTAAPDMSPAERCSECRSAMAHDQRYCVECGARRGPLPARIAAQIAGVYERGASAAPGLRHAAGSEADADGSAAAPIPADGDGDGASERPRLPLIGEWVPTPRMTAAAVFGVLGFGSVVGSLVGTSPADLLNAAEQVIVAVSPASQAPPAAVAAASTSSGANNSGASNSGGSNSSSSSSSSSVTPAGPASTTASTTTTPTTPTTPTQYPYPPPVKHVFVIMLSDQGYSKTFGGTDKYFSQSLPKQGELLESYYSVTSGELANEIALISGQGPTPQTAADCQTYADFAATGTSATMHQLLGSGCVYPKTTTTLAGELAKKGGYKAYIEDSDPVPKGLPATCRHPAIGAVDPNFAPPATDRYETWRDPFLYFHSLIDGKSCGKTNVPFTQFAADLSKASTTPALSYIVPSPCSNGSDTPCAPGAPAGLKPAEAFVKTVLSEIEQSPAYKADGLIALTFDQSPQIGLSPGTTPDTSSCCDAQVYPNLPAGGSPATTTTPATTGTPGTSTTPAATTTPTATTPTTTTTTTNTTPTTPAAGLANLLATLVPSTTSTPVTQTTPTTPTSTTPTSTTPTTTTPTATTPTTTTPTGATPTPTGGGQVGMLLISKYVKAGCPDTFDQFNHFSFLKTIEKLFKVKDLGYASDPSLSPFGIGVFNAGSPTACPGS